MPESDDSMLMAQAYGRVWPRFLLLCCALLLAGSGFLLLTGSGMAAPSGNYGEPLKFAPPPVDLEYNSEGVLPAPDSAEPAKPQVQRANAPARTAQTGRTGGGAGEPPGSSRLFGTVEFRSALKNLPKWERVLKVEKAQPTFLPGSSRMPENVASRWKVLAAELEGKPLKEQAQKVNNFFNQWPYKTDLAVWGVEDYWATPAEFLKKSGDCEDYAIAKYYALRELGVPADKLRILVLVDSIRNLGHAVLVVYYDDNAYILDNLTNLVLSHQKLTHYVPKYSVNEQYLWRHVRPVDKQNKK